MADQGSRQDRMGAFQPSVGPADLLSADAERYTEQVAALQAEARADPVYNGKDAARRLRGTDG
jgi:hypothetical protein